MKYDDASWHYGGDFPKGLNNEAGATDLVIVTEIFFTVEIIQKPVVFRISIIY